jgi:uncharacterized protein YihD (DUF1040 family)
MDSLKSLWGEISQTEIVRTPFTILKEQSAILANQTKGLLVGEVSRKQAVKNDSILTLRILAASLGYRYEVVQVHHDVNLYPLTIMNLAVDDAASTVRCNSEQEFEQALEKILSSPQVKRVISVLLSDIRASSSH